MITKQSFYYLRHGKTDWNQQGLVQGQADIPLNDTGIAQAYAAQKHFEKIKIDRICCSPLLRAKQTAEIINEKLQVPLISIEQLKEIYLGSFEGKPREQFLGSHAGFPTRKDWLQEWREGKAHDDKMETYVNYKARIIAGLNQALTYGNNTLIVGHGMVHRTLLDLQNFQGELYLDNCTPVYHQATDGPWLIIPLDSSDTEKLT